MVNTGRGITDRFIFFILPYVYNKYIILVKSEKNINIKKKGGGNSLAAQWLGLHASTAGGQDSIPGWELSYHKSHSSAKKKKKREFMGKKKTYMEKGKDVDKPPSPEGLWPQLSGQAHLQWGTRSPGWRRPGQGSWWRGEVRGQCPLRPPSSNMPVPSAPRGLW